MAFGRLINYILTSARKAARKTGVQENNLAREITSLELHLPASALFRQHTPRAAFVETLGRRLAEAHAARAGRSTRSPLQVVRSRWAARGALALVVLTAIITTVLIMLIRQQAPETVSAAVLNGAAERLLELSSVRYEAITEIGHGVCFVAHEASLTEADKATLAADGRATADTGTVYGCEKGRQVVSETGVYALQDRAFAASTHWVEGHPTGLIGLNGVQIEDSPSQRVFVNGRLYVQERDRWRLVPSQNVWAPFTFSGPAQVPSGNLDALRSAYERVEKLGESTLDGVRVAHYKASRTTSAGHENVEAWIGTEDSLPRKVIITLELPNPEDLFRDRIFIVPVDPESPIVRRGEWPEVSVVTYTYSFSDFNAPVEITPPVR